MSEFINCSKCGKRLIVRKDDGSLYFRFGSTAEPGVVPVEIMIRGSVTIKCIRKHCGHWNTILEVEGGS